MAPALFKEYPQALPVIAERITGLQHMEWQDEKPLILERLLTLTAHES
jgi:hypothetical protein